jgi:putative transposase
VIRRSSARKQSQIGPTCGALAISWLPFVDTDAANRWVARFVSWYNGEHRHSGIRYVTPNERHDGREHTVLAGRRELYAKARASNPERWSREIRNWSPVGLVVLNPEPAERTAA